MALCDLETFLSPRRRLCQTWRHKISFRVTWDIIFTTTEETTKQCEVRVTFFESKWMFAPDLVRFSQCALKILCTRTVGMGNQTLFIWPQLLLPLMPQEHLPVNGLSFIFCGISYKILFAMHLLTVCIREVEIIYLTHMNSCRHLLKSLLVHVCGRLSCV